jgi:tetratricopeptide (TPR) repeat protein
VNAADDAEITCSNGTGDMIAACTRVIDAGRYTGINLAPVFYNRGHAWRDKGDLDRAIADYDQAIKLDPGHFAAYYNRGHAWRAKGDLDRAITDYSQAIRLDPKSAGAYNNRGNSWQDKGDLDHALADYDGAIRLDPYLAGAYNNRGNTRRAKGDFDRAIADYNQAIRLDPAFAMAYNNRGTAWYIKGDFDRAIADYDQTIRLDPKEASAYRARGDAWRDKGDLHRAMADYDKALSLDETSVNAYRGRGLINFVHGEFSDAASDFLRVNDLKPDAYVMLWRFLARFRIGQDATTELSTTAAHLKPADWPYPVVEFYVGRRTASDMQRAASTPGENCEAAFYLGEWLLIRGDKPEASNNCRMRSIRVPRLSTNMNLPSPISNDSHGDRLPRRTPWTTQGRLGP